MKPSAHNFVASPQLDVVITNALVVDYTGIYKADVGIRGGLIVGIGKAGNPDTMDGVTKGIWYNIYISFFISILLVHTKNHLTNDQWYQFK